MALLLNEIAPGAVAYFDHLALHREPEIDRGDDSLNRSGPFVCVQVVGDKSVWCAVTSKCRHERLMLLEHWIENGYGGWLSDDLYINDGLNTYVGPNSAFQRAASGYERPFLAGRRPTIIAEGVRAILATVDREGGPLLVPVGADGIPL